MSYNLPQTVACDAPGDADLASFKYYVGLSTSAFDSLKTVATTSTSATLTGLLNGLTYYFAATALDASGNESTYGNVISKTINVSVLQLVRQVK